MDPKEILFRVHITRSFSLDDQIVFYTIHPLHHRYEWVEIVIQAQHLSRRREVITLITMLITGGIRIFFFSFNRATLMDFHQRYVLWPHAPVSRFNAWESPQRNPFSPFLLLLLSGEVNVLGKKEKIIREIDTRLTRCTCTRVHHACDSLLAGF